MSKRRKEMREKKRERLERRSLKAYAQPALPPLPPPPKVPPGAIKANVSRQSSRGGYGLRFYYEDKEFDWRDCGKAEVWTAEDQKWYFEVIQANILSEAVYCAECRKKRKIAKAEQKQHMEDLKAAEDGTGT